MADTVDEGTTTNNLNTVEDEGDTVGILMGIVEREIEKVGGRGISTGDLTGDMMKTETGVRIG